VLLWVRQAERVLMLSNINIAVKTAPRDFTSAHSMMKLPSQLSRADHALK